MKKLLLCLMAIGSLLLSSAQCLLKEVQLQQRIAGSSLIIEGKVIAKRSFWNSDHSMIYTANRVEVFKIFKGTLTSDVIDIITAGGTVDYTKIQTSSLLSLEPDQTGIFLCENIRTFRNLPAPASGVPQFEAFASRQGFIQYDLQEETASDVFQKYNDVENGLYKLLSPSRQYTEVRPFSLRSRTTSQQRIMAISGFSPTTVTAGTGTVITINGSSFGATQGSGFVAFANADDGGATVVQPLPSQYISWSSTQIQVQVPSNAGTGLIRVVQGTTSTSATPLTVSYAHLNVDFDPGSGTIAYQPDHVNDNGTGGYTWRMNTGFDGNAAAKASFLRAFETWRCGTGVNWQTGATTAINDAVSDGTNVICFDNTAPLSAGVLGVCYSYWSGCASGPTILWFVNELDIIFDEGSNISPLTWEFGTGAPSGSEYDFETVAVHELGHGHQLGHVIVPGAIMHYAIANGVANRSLSANDLAGGNFVQTRSEVANVCGPGAMTAYAGCATLPLTITSLKAYQKGNGIQVEWTNSSESSVHHYEIEESHDGTSFVPAHSQAPAVNNFARADYGWLDPQVNNGDNYYRIKTIGSDGRTEYSITVRVKTGRNRQLFQVYPNPVKGNGLTLEMNGFEKGVYQVTLYSSGGQQVLRRRTVHQGGNATETIALPALAAGVYRLKLEGNGISVDETVLIDR